MIPRVIETPEYRAAKLTIWDNPLIVQGIVDAAGIGEHDRLALVSKTFASVINRPAMWAKKYAPATIDADLRTVFTAAEFAPRSRWEQSPQKFITKKFKGEQWFIRAVSPPKYPTDPESVSKLDHTCRLNPFNYEYASERNDVSAIYLDAIDAQRQAAYSLLLNRGYLRAHGRGPSGRGRILTATAMIPVLLGVLFAAANACITSLSKPNERSQSQFLKDVLVFFAMFSAVIALQNCIGTVIYAPQADPILNRYADDFYGHALTSIAKEEQRRSREMQRAGNDF